MPADSQLNKVFTEAMASQKLEMNMKNGQEMLSELPFYEVDPDELGSESEGEGQYEQSDENKLAMIL